MNETVKKLEIQINAYLEVCPKLSKELNLHIYLNLNDAHEIVKYINKLEEKIKYFNKLQEDGYIIG